MPALKLALLGGFDARVDAGPSITFPTRKSKALLAYLALHPGQPHAREAVAALLWENSPDARARSSLRQALTALRRGLFASGYRGLVTDGDTVALDAMAVYTDVSEFERLLDKGGPEALERGLALYRGELLQGFSFREEGFEEWLWQQRERLRGLALKALGSLLAHYIGAGAVGPATAVGGQLLALDPLREDVHRALMELYLEQGERAAALHQYRICRQILDRELDVKPDAETERLYERVRHSSAPPVLSGKPGSSQVLAHRAEDATPGGVGLSADRELRQVTVLFADLAGFSRFSDEAGLELAHAALARYLGEVEKVVRGYGGSTARHLGDTVMAMFGYPTAHEDDARRAVEAGMELVESLAGLEIDAAPGADVLPVRVGISTGLVLAGELGGSQEVVGMPVTVAARLAGAAPPGSVVIGESTRRLVEGLFEHEALACRSAVGLSEPLAAYRVHAHSPAPSRFEATADRGLTPLVGREGEIALLRERWRQVENGEGQVVLISGEAGIGKSRIVREFYSRLSSSRVLYYCSPIHASSALYPAIRQLERALRFNREESAKQKLDKLDATVRSLGLAARDTIPYIAPVLSLPLLDRYPESELSGQALKRRTLETFSALVESEARREPVLMAIEDVQWADPTTLELAEQLIERARTTRLLLIITYRPEFMAPWCSHPHVTLHTLNSLDREESRQMVGRVAGGKKLPEEVAEQILAKTDGVPLFVEELTKTVLDSDLLEEAGDAFILSAPLPALAIPDTLQESLTARLDRLGAVKGVAQLAASIGRGFSHELIAAVSPLPEEELREALAQLGAADIIHLRGISADVQYEFKHALVQDAAYHSLPKSKRAEYHLRVARTLEASFPRTVETEPETLAWHYAEAGKPEPAITYWQRAGERAVRRSANLEAINHYRKGLELVPILPQDAHRDRRELALQLALGAALIAPKSYAAEEVRVAFERSEELSRRTGESTRLFPALRGLWNYHVLRAELDEASLMARRLLTLADESGNGTWQLMAQRIAGTTWLGHGQYQTAKVHFERGVGLYSPVDQESYVLSYGEDPGLYCHAYGAWVEDWTGHRDTASRHVERTLALAQDLPNRYAQAYVLALSARMYMVRREVQKVLDAAGEAAEIAHERGISQWSAMADVCSGWALAKQGAVKRGFEQARQGAALWRAIGARFDLSNFLVVLAEIHGLGGKPETGLSILDEAEGIVRETGYGMLLSELYRQRGELMHETSGMESAAAEEQFLKAVSVARDQQAKLLELRAVTSLARLKGAEGRRDEARNLLAPVYEWFAEGFDTADLKEARALLDELS